MILFDNLIAIERKKSVLLHKKFAKVFLYLSQLNQIGTIFIATIIKAAVKLQALVTNEAVYNLSTIRDNI